MPEDSSFTTLSAERTIAFGVTMFGGVSGPVQWQVVDDPSNQVQSGTPTTPLPGIQSSVDIPGPLTLGGEPDTSRWILAQHNDPASTKALEFTLTATASRPGGGTIASAPVVLRQHEKDVLRQEYVDFRIGDLLPPRTDLKTATDITSIHFTFAELAVNEDYSFAFLDDALITRLDALRDSVGSAVPVTSGFRNPVHHRFHITRLPGDQIALRSNHQTGNAADLGVNNSVSRWKLVRRRAIEQGLCVEPFSRTLAGHVHVDWRGGRANCPAGW